MVAVDIPSGLAGEDNTWNDPETIVCAEYTFTFQFPKLAFMLAENEKYVGRWEVLDIGLHPEIIARQPTDWFYTTEDTVKAILPPSPVFAHKGTNGKGLLIAGSYGMMGAAVLGLKRLYARVSVCCTVIFRVKNRGDTDDCAGSDS